MTWPGNQYGEKECFSLSLSCKGNLNVAHIGIAHEELCVIIVF